MDVSTIESLTPNQCAQLRGVVCELDRRLEAVDDLLPALGAPRDNGELRTEIEAAFGAVAIAVEPLGLRRMASICRRASRLAGLEGRDAASLTAALEKTVRYLRLSMRMLEARLDGNEPDSADVQAVQIAREDLIGSLPAAEAESDDAPEFETSDETKSLLILVVDDEEIIRLYLNDLLSEMGHQVVTAADGVEAIHEIETGFYDLIFTDIKMPGADGIQVLKKAKEVCPDAEVVVVTGFASVENAAAAVHYGAYDYVTKPFERVEMIHSLVERVGRSIRLRRENRRLMLELRMRNLELKRNVQSLEDALKEVEEKQRALIHADRMSSLGVLAAGVAHEINNPTTFIRGNLQTLQKFWEILAPVLAGENGSGVPDPKKLRFVCEETPGLIRDMLVGTDRITRIVSGLRAFAHPEGPAERAPADPHACIEDALALVESSVPENVEVVRDFCADPPQVPIALQPMTQVFVNLLLNAIQAVEGQDRGRVTVRSQPEEGAFRVDVIDDGVGMTDAVLEKVFDPFFTTKPVDKGTGLGLSILLGIVQDHGGSVATASTPGAGSCFSVRLPLEEAPEREVERKPRLLIVDDDPEYLRLLQRAVAEWGEYDVETAEGGFQAVYSMGERCPDVLILDMRMPDLDGFDVLRAIGENPEWQNIRVLALTGLESKALRERLSELQVDAFFRKPLDFEELRAELKHLTGPVASVS